MRIGSIDINGNLYVFAVLGVLFGLAFLFGEARLRRVVVAMLVGLFAADQLTDFAITQIGHIGLKDLDPTLVRLGLLLLVMLALSLGKVSASGGRFSVRSFVLATTASATFIAYTNSFLALTSRESSVTEYNLIAIAVNNQSWWLTSLIAWLVVLHIFKQKSKDDDEGGKKGKKK